MMNLHRIRFGASMFGWVAIAVVATAVCLPLAAGDSASLSINDGPVANYTDLYEAIGEANSAGAGGSKHGTKVVITVSGNQSRQDNITVPAVDSLFFILGSSADNLTSGNGFSSVTLDGGGFTLKSTASGDSYRVLEIINVKDDINVSNMTITGGAVSLLATNTNAGEFLGGGGFHIGAASPFSKKDIKPITPGIAPDRISLSDMTITGNSVKVKIDGSVTTFDEASRAAYGGGGFIDGTMYHNSDDTQSVAHSKVTLNDVNFTANTVELDASDNLVTTGSGSATFGGGLRVKNVADFVYEGGTIANNSVTTLKGSHAAGGGIAIDDYSISARLSQLTISGNKAIAKESGISGDAAKAMGGGLYTYHDGTITGGNPGYLDLVIDDKTTFVGNYAEAEGSNVNAYGGGTYLNGYTIGTLSDIDFTDNYATSKDGNAFGGGLALTSFFDGSEAYFNDNDNKDEDGNFYVLTITGGKFSGNFAEAKLSALGGGIYIERSNSFDVATVKLSGVTLTGNWVAADTNGEAKGGGIYSEDTLTVVNSKIIGNEARGIEVAPVGPDDDPTYKDILTAMGAGIYAEGDVTISGSTIGQNTATASAASGTAAGGGIYAEENLDIGASTLSKNAVIADGTNGEAYGGGMYVGGDLTITSSDTAGSLISENMASANGDNGLAEGGGINVVGDLTIESSEKYNSVVSSNIASATGDGGKAYGGGIYSTASGEVNITGTTQKYAGINKNEAIGNVVAKGGGIYANGDLSIEYAEVHSNKATATAENGIAHGGGIYADTGSTVELANSYVRNNRAGGVVVDEDDEDDDAVGNIVADARGGGIYTVEELGIFGKSYIDYNQAEGNTALGGGIYAKENVNLGNAITDEITVANNKGIAHDGDAQGGGVYTAKDIVVLGNLELIKNSAETAEGTAQGGGFYAEGKIEITGNRDPVTGIDPDTETTITIAGNTVTATSDDPTEGLAQGGAMYTESYLSIKDVSKLEISSNTATGDSAMGGALYAEGDMTIIGNTSTDADAEFLTTIEIKGNKVVGEDSAYGGAIYTDGDLSITKIAGMAIAGNTATGGEAMGGAIYASGNVELQNAVISGNAAKGVTEDGDDGVGYGGAIYAKGDVKLTDTSIIGNSATGEDHAQGGGIYMDMEGRASGKITIIASADSTDPVSIKGNTADGKSSGIYFGNNDTSTNAVLDITANGNVELLDSVYVDLTGTGNRFDLSVSGTGKFTWDGANRFSVGDNGTVTIEFDADEIYLGADFTAKVGLADNSETNSLELSIGTGTTLSFDGTRDRETALFSFNTGGASNVLLVDSTAGVYVDLSSELTSKDEIRYLFAENYDGANLDFLTATYSDEYYTTHFERDSDGKVWLVTEYRSKYQGLINSADPNTKAGLDSGAMDEMFKNLTPEQRAILASDSKHFNNATPGWLMNGVMSGHNTILAGADAARSFGLSGVGGEGGNGYLGMRASSTTGLANFLTETQDGYYGPRFWTGYIGDFDRMDSHGGYYGYKSSRHGILFGINYDAGTVGSIGLYGGYSKTTTKARTVVGEIKSDTGHVGVIGSLAPMREMPNLLVQADAGYTFSSNDSTRGAGSLNTTGEYDQKYYTAGMEVSYTSRFGNSYLTPFASVRYVRMKQDAFSETGALASHMSSINEGSTYTRVGAAMGTKMQTTFGTITPSVSAAWRHNFDDGRYSANTYFMGAVSPSATSYKVRSAKVDQDSVDIGAAIRASLLGEDEEKSLGLNFGYNLNTSKNRSNHSVFVGLDMSF